MPSIVKLPSRLGKANKEKLFKLTALAKGKKVLPSMLNMQLAVSGIAAISGLLLAFETSEVQFSEMYKALAIGACLNMFRLIANNNTSIQK
ncbi:hypothetical protein ACFSRY_12100 [Pontibacter locisalis]|uniref:Uncharacterized protein n=1 Tax=Pontibacter locisalis TaxID=1719035 RepID=A0ABW5IRH2_9BACT